MQWTVADITFIENHGNGHLHFCGEFMSRSIYINDMNSSDGTQGTTDCLKRWSPSDVVQSAPRRHHGETKSSWSQEWIPHLKRKSSADSGHDSSLPPSVQQGGDNISRVRPPDTREIPSRGNLSSAADFMRSIEISISLGFSLDLLQLVI